MRRYALLVGGAGILLGLSACRAITPSSAPQSTASQSATSQSSAPGTSAPDNGTLRVLTEPKDGAGQLYQFIDSARSSVDLTMYELDDHTAEADLAAAAARGADVRVILDQHLEKSRNTAAYDYLAGHHVHVTWAPDGTTYHQKTLTVDDKTSVIMTLNMVTDDYAGTRDFAVVDTDHTDVSAIVATFNADFTSAPVTPPDGTDLVWSPTNSRSSILSVIDGAKHTLMVENEEMDDSTVTSALARAAKRGVDVTVVMTADREWDQAFSELVAAGVHIRLYPDNANALYIHAKAVVADAGHSGQQVFVGSENFSSASLGRNRELGIRTANGRVISAISAAIASDYSGASPYSA